MSEKCGILMWFEFSKDFKFKVRTGKSKRLMPNFVGKGERIEMFIAVADKSNDYEEREAISFATGHKSFESGSFKNIKNYLLLPKECMISAVGDIFCARDKTVFAVMHFGKSGWWGHGKRLLCNPDNFNYCPNCGGKMAKFPPFPNENHPSRRLAAISPTHSEIFEE